MAHKFETLFRKLPTRIQKRVEKRAEMEYQALALSELREAQDLTQVELAKKLGIDQGAVSKIERRTDMYLSTLQNVIAAMGGELELTARFPSGEARMVTFQARNLSRRNGAKRSSKDNAIRQRREKSNR